MCGCSITLNTSLQRGVYVGNIQNYGTALKWYFTQSQHPSVCLPASPTHTPALRNALPLNILVTRLISQAQEPPQIAMFA